MSRVVLVLVLVLVAAVPASAQPWKKKKEPGVAFSWEVVPGTRKSELYANGHKIGLWDGEEERYYRVNVDGTLTGPLVPPWPRRQPEPEETPTRTEPKVEAPPEPQPDPALAWYEELPPWSGYAIGGALTLIITGVGLAMQFRKT